MRIDKTVRDSILEFLYKFEEVAKIEGAVITGGAVRDISLGQTPNDYDVLIKTEVPFSPASFEGMYEEPFLVFENYGEDPSHFGANYVVCAKDTVNNIDYLFLHHYRTFKEVIDSFDCSLNKGTADVHTGIITPPDLTKFDYCMEVGSVERFNRFSAMFAEYHSPVITASSMYTKHHN